MKNNKQASAQSPQDILNELHDLVSEAEKMVTEDGPAATEDAISSLRSRFQAAQEKLGDVYDNAREKVSAGARYTDTTIRENPYQSIAIAAGVGVLVGVLLGRRNR